MSVDPWTIGLEIVNFLVLVWLLERLLYRPVLGVISRRQAEIDALREADEAAEAALETERARIAREREALAAEREHALEVAHAQANEERSALLAEAREEVDRLLASGRARLAEERTDAARALRRKSAELGVAVARRLLDMSRPTRGDGRFLDTVVQRLEQTDARDRTRLLAGGDDEDRVRVVTAQPLDEAERTRCAERLTAAVGRPLEAAFEVDPDLVAGLEVHFPGLVLRHSWRSALQEITADLEASAETET